jgi:hypothetical protein
MVLELGLSTHEEDRLIVSLSVFWVVTLCELVDYNVPEGYTASVFRAESTSSSSQL